MSDDIDLEVVLLDLEEKSDSQSETSGEKMECKDEDESDVGHIENEGDNGVEQREDKDVARDSPYKPKLEQTKECAWGDELEEKVNQLHDELTGIPKIYIRRVLKREDVNGNLEHAKSLLRDHFQDEGCSGEQEKTETKTKDDLTRKEPTWKKTGSGAQKKQSGNTKKDETQQNVGVEEPSKVLPQEERRDSTSEACGSKPQKESQQKSGEDASNGARGKVAKGGDTDRFAAEKTSKNTPKQRKRRGKKPAQQNQGGQWQNRGNFRGGRGRGQNWQHQRGGRGYPGLGREDRGDTGRGGRQNDSWRFSEGPRDSNQWDYGSRGSYSQMRPPHGGGWSYYEEQYEENIPYQAGAAWSQRGRPNEKRPRGTDWGYRGRGYPRGGGRGRGMHQAYSREDLSSQDSRQRHQDFRASSENLSRGDHTDDGPREAWANPQDALPQQTNADRGRRNSRGRGRGREIRDDRCNVPGSNVPNVSGANVSETPKSSGANLPVGSESNKLLVKGLRKQTTSDGLQNYMELVSGEEVLETVFLEDGHALVTLQNNIDLAKTKAKAQRRPLEGAYVVLERVPACTSVLVQDLSDNTTEDAICLYFENTKRSAGGTVERVEFKTGEKHAIVHFADPNDAENVVLREQTKPHVLNNEQLRVSKFYPFMKVDVTEPAMSQPTSTENAADDTKNRPAANATQSMHFAVDVDKMELIIASNHHANLSQALDQHQSEFNWKPGSSTAVITYRGQESNPEAWQSACVEEISSCLNQFDKCDVQVEDDFWKAICDQFPSIEERLDKLSVLLKCVEDSRKLRIICLRSDINTIETKLRDHLEEIKDHEIKKTYSRTKESGIPEEKIALLNKINFAENLMQKHCDLEVVIDDENGEISFEGPKEQFKEAMMFYRKQMNAMSSRILNLKPKVIEILYDKMDMVTEAFKRNEIDAVFVIDEERGVTEVVGASSAHAQQAADLVSGLVVEEKVSVEEESLSLMQTRNWREFCSQMEEELQVEMRTNKWGDTWILGVAENVKKTTEKVKEFVDEHTVKKSKFSCASEGMKRFLVEQRKDEMKKIEENLKDFQVKIEKGDSAKDFDITGIKEGLSRAQKMLQLLTAKENVFTDTIEIKQPGLRKCLTEGKGEKLVREVERDHECVIELKHSFTKIIPESDSAESDPKPDEDDVDSDDDVSVYGDVTVGSSSALTVGNCRITWKAGDITKEQADILVTSEGACSASILQAAGQGMAQVLTQPRSGDVTTTAGFNLPCSHVFHTKCRDYDAPGGNAEKYLRRIVQKCLAEGTRLQMNSIAFPVIGTGKRGFPPNEASRIMLQECVQFFQTNQGSSIIDVRFVVFAKDQALVTAFGQEVAAVSTTHVSGRRQPRNVASTVGTNIRIQVRQGDITREQTVDAIININGPDMNMQNAGALSKAIAQASGPAVQMECTNAGQQTAGAAVITSGGNLAVRHIIHSAPGSADKQHLQQCVENALRVADSNGLQSVSLPAFGTGAFHLSAQDSAALIFQAIANFSPTCQSVREINVVIFQLPMVPAFTQEHQKWAGTTVTHRRPVGAQGTIVNVQVKQGSITQEQTDAIVNINSTDMDMQRAGALSKAIALASGPAVQMECTNAGKQTAGAAVMTSGGNLTVRHIIHSTPGSGDKQHLQQCVENSLRLADNNGLRSVSLPAFGTGGFGLSEQDSAELTFQALASFSPTSQNVRQVNIVIFQPQMVQAFNQEQQKQVGTTAPRPVPRPRSYVPKPSTRGRDVRMSAAVSRSTQQRGAKFCVLAKNEESTIQAVSALKKSFSEVCTIQNIKDKAVKMLTDKQLSQLQRRAVKLDVEMKVGQEAGVDCITVRGGPNDVTALVAEILSAINDSKEKQRAKENVKLVAKNVQWQYNIGGVYMPFDKKTNAELEKAFTNDKTSVTVSLRGENYKIDFPNSRGVGQDTGNQMTISRKVLGASAEGITLPTNWVPMPRDPHTGNDATVHLVSLVPSSQEYQTVAQQFQRTVGNVGIRSIERVQNPVLYQAYQVRKQKMDKDNAGQNNERQLFHGTSAESVTKINTQGFNRSFAGTHGKAYGAGVYFARDASYSLRYASGNAGSKPMYIARVLVGQYVLGNSGMMVPPPKNSSRTEITYESTVDNASNPSIFVVFYDNQCYPEYLIRF